MQHVCHSALMYLGRVSGHFFVRLVQHVTCTNEKNCSQDTRALRFSLCAVKYMHFV